MESILTSIKKLLGIEEEYKHFDTDIILHINTTFTTLTQLGVGPKDGFLIADEMETWDRFLEGATNLEAVKTYVYLQVKLLFDPPASSSVIEAINRKIGELEWRLNVQTDQS
jgi:hypothetical protein